MVYLLASLLAMVNSPLALRPDFTRCGLGSTGRVVMMSRSPPLQARPPCWSSSLQGMSCKCINLSVVKGISFSV